ncbi:MAG: hypothetical protein PHF61_03525 [Bacteroidales bacterium]|nr:hypothetical protein [Bacteroidales bacterium]MDD4430457.1 hypothetical protein [Bacteroidales bacterium]
MQEWAYFGIDLLLFTVVNMYICPASKFIKYVSIYFKNKSMFFEMAYCLNNDISIHKTDLISVNQIDLKPFSQKIREAEAILSHLS